MRDKPMLEYPEKMCEYCCNFDKEHIGMDGTALCKLTMTLAYAEDYGGNCMFYNVPKEQIIVPPCKVGDTIYYPWVYDGTSGIAILEVSRICLFRQKINLIFYDDVQSDMPMPSGFFFDDFGKTVFLTKEEAEKALAERSGNGTSNF